MKLSRIFVVALALMASASSAWAVNCEQVKRYAQTGRTPEQIAETMIVDVGEVKKCLEAAPAAEQGTKSDDKPAEGSGH